MTNKSKLNKKMKNEKTYIIAEIGQNHNGDIALAKKLIDMAAMPIFTKTGDKQIFPVDAVKFCKRDLSEELTKEEYDKPYNSPNSFGKTYGEHREKLEFSYKQYGELEKYARKKGLDFVVTLCSPKTLKVLDFAKLDYIKVASRDLTNIPLLEAISKTKIPIILSRGMSDNKEISEAIKVINKVHSKISILHCVSEYPAKPSNLNLRAIPALYKKYGKKYKIGYSDHSVGIIAPVMAVTLGAEIIEKHITIDHQMKGSDHAGSLEMEGLWRMTRDIRNAEDALGQETIQQPNIPQETIHRLRRSLASVKNIKKGEIIKENMLCMLSPGSGIQWTDRKKILGKKSQKDIPAQSLISFDMFK